MHKKNALILRKLFSKVCSSHYEARETGHSNSGCLSLSLSDYSSLDWCFVFFPFHWEGSAYAIQQSTFHFVCHKCSIFLQHLFFCGYSWKSQAYVKVSKSEKFSSFYKWSYFIRNLNVGMRSKEMILINRQTMQIKCFHKILFPYCKYWKSKANCFLFFMHTEDLNVIWIWENSNVQCFNAWYLHVVVLNWCHDLFCERPPNS